MQQIIRMLSKNAGILFLLFVIAIALCVCVFPQRGLHVKFYPNAEWSGSPSISQQVDRIDFAPIAQKTDFLKKNFSAAWSGWIRLDQTGEYTFATNSDDGSSLFIDGEKVVENGGFHGAQKASGTRRLARGMHELEIAYMQGAGSHKLEVFWTPPGKGEASLPRDILYVEQPFRGISFLTRHRRTLIACCSLLLAIVFVKRTLRKRSGSISEALRAGAANAAVSLLAIIVCLLLIEGGMRLFLWGRQDSRTLSDLPEQQSSDASPMYRGLGDIIQPSLHHGIIYELKPHLNGTFLGASLTTNSQGLRDVEYAIQKPEQTVRIVGLGDSSMFGWGVEMANTSLHLLEERLNQDSSGRRYEVMNFAVPGYNTAIQVEVFLKKCLNYSPDFVILHFNTNDYDIPNFMKRPQNYGTLRKSYLFDFIYMRYQALQGKHTEEALAPMVLGPLEETEFLDESPTIPEAYRYMVGKRGFLAAMETLIRVTKERQIPLLVFVIKPEADTDSFRGRQLALIQELRQKHGFWLLNTYPNYAAYLQDHPERSNQDFWVSPTDTHPSVLAHEIEAAAFREYLINAAPTLFQ